MISITNLDLRGALFLLVLMMVWFFSIIAILSDFAYFITRRSGINKTCKHIFEVTALLPMVFAGWSWRDEQGVAHPASWLAGHIMIILSLVAYIYSIYRKDIAALGIEIVVNCLLFAGWASTIFFSTSLDNFGNWVFIDLPVNILFVQALLENYQKLRTHRQRMRPSPALPNRE
jgi:hypothetical protein